MKNIEQVIDYRFPNGSWPIAVLGVRILELADQLGVQVESWNEDGLGKVVGLLLKLPSERVIMLREFEQQIQSRGLERGALEVSFDASEVATFGVEPLVSEALECLGLSKAVVDWLAPTAAQKGAADLIQHYQNLFRDRL